MTLLFEEYTITIPYSKFLSKQILNFLALLKIEENVNHIIHMLMIRLTSTEHESQKTAGAGATDPVKTFPYWSAERFL